MIKEKETADLIRKSGPAEESDHNISKNDLKLKLMRAEAERQDLIDFGLASPVPGTQEQIDTLLERWPTLEQLSKHKQKGDHIIWYHVYIKRGRLWIHWKMRDGREGNEAEIWKAWYMNPRYLISSFGRVWDSEDNRRGNENIGPRFLNFKSHCRGYNNPSFTSTDGVQYSVLTHRLVAKLFTPNGNPHKNEVNHILEGKLFKGFNFHLSLEWVSKRANNASRSAYYKQSKLPRGIQKYEKQYLGRITIFGKEFSTPLRSSVLEAQSDLNPILSLVRQQKYFEAIEIVVKTMKVKSSFFKGVAWVSHHEKWRIKIKGKHIGLFDNELSAAQSACDHLGCELHGLYRLFDSIDQSRTTGNLIKEDFLLYMKIRIKAMMEWATN